MQFPELDQGMTRLCGPFCIEAAQDAVGRHVGAKEIYEQVKGRPYVPPGDPMTFPELVQGITRAATMGKCAIRWWNAPPGAAGVINDPGTLVTAVTAGFVTIAGVWMADLIPGQDYYHFVLVHGFDRDGDGVREVLVVDSYAREDGGSDRYRLNDFIRAMVDNWTPDVDAIAYMLGPE